MFFTIRNRAPMLLWALLVVLLISSGFTSTFGAQGEQRVLARIEVTRRLDTYGLPIYAHLIDAKGADYALSIASQTQLKRSGALYQVLDASTTGASYAVIEPHRKNGKPATPAGLAVLYNDGVRWLVRSNQTLNESLRMSGYHVQALEADPMVLRAAEPAIASLEAVPTHPVVTQIINGVSQNTIYTYIGNMTGENPVMIGGSNYTITTRATGSGTPIQKATQYAYEFMQSKGLTVSYHNWSSGGYSNRNVVAEKRGTTRPNEIVLIGAHLDSRPYSGAAPGADDNASGSIALMIGGELFSQHNFERTIRFVFFTGEEQGLLGSTVYASKMVSEGANLVAVINMDMIAWDGNNTGRIRLQTRSTSNPGYAGDRAIANLYADVVSSYGISGLIPVHSSAGETNSDHAPFWNRGFSALYELESTTSPHWHQSSDRRSTLNMTTYTNAVKASLGTIAHLGVPAGSVTPTPVTITPTPGTTIFDDDFETNKGWTTNAGGSDTATTGQWERGDPEPTDENGPKQLGTTASGMNDLVTGRLAGSAVGDYDVDAGVTSIRSPSISLPSGSNPTLTFKYTFAHGSNGGSDDYFRLKVIGSSTTTMFEKLATGVDVDASWTSASVNLSSYAGQSVRLQFEGADNGGASLIEAAVDDVRITGSTSVTPTPITPTPITPTPGPGTVFGDDFETNKGWTTNAGGSDTATTGQWERGDPEATDYNGPKQLGSTTSGMNDLVTGRLAGAASGDYDLDGGLSSIRSPSITLPASGNLTLTFSYYLAHASNAGSDDYLRVKVVGSSTTTVFERLGAASDVDAAWQTATINLSSFAGQTVRLQFEAADLGTGSLIEAAVDDVVIANN